MEKFLNNAGKKIFGFVAFCVCYAFMKSLLDTGFSMNSVIAIALISFVGIYIRLGKILDKMSEKD